MALFLGSKVHQDCCGLSSLLHEYFERKFRIGLCSRFPRDRKESPEVVQVIFPRRRRAGPFFCNAPIVLTFCHDPKIFTNQISIKVASKSKSFEGKLWSSWTLRVVEIINAVRPVAGDSVKGRTAKFSFCCQKRAPPRNTLRTTLSYLTRGLDH